MDRGTMKGGGRADGWAIRGYTYTGSAEPFGGVFRWDGLF